MLVLVPWKQKVIRHTLDETLQYARVDHRKILGNEHKFIANYMVHLQKLSP